ncbi:hypothetical protein GCM10011346_03210 [Oceanobacillus neutriphilus]|uniref:Uncharacterized protein n=1 Tax=Oceanobacillus neutriphilus TaxID=531815 RepID=A0ABQ2NMU3_9BACI|nr:hypothetical protein GCM10011346_03210 [Oceanobacillus neutriphilus]
MTATADRFAFLGARSSANFCQEEHLAKVDLQMVLIPQESKRSASASRIFYTEITEQIKGRSDRTNFRVAW